MVFSTEENLFEVIFEFWGGSKIKMQIFTIDIPWPVTFWYLCQCRQHSHIWIWYSAKKNGVRGQIGYFKSTGKTFLTLSWVPRRRRFFIPKEARANSFSERFTFENKTSYCLRLDNFVEQFVLWKSLQQTICLRKIQLNNNSCNFASSRSEKSEKVFGKLILLFSTCYSAFL